MRKALQRAACWVREGVSIHESACVAFHPALASSIPHHFSDITRLNSQTHQNKSGVTSANIFFKFQGKTTLQEHGGLPFLGQGIQVTKIIPELDTIPQAFGDQGSEGITTRSSSYLPSEEVQESSPPGSPP